MNMADKQHIWAPYVPPKYELADVTAIQALAAGTADADQQKRALGYIIEELAGTYDMPYRPGGMEGERDTSFACGRMFVGQQIRKMVKINIDILRRK